MTFKPTHVILHCSDTLDFGDKIGVKQIDDWHRNERGWRGCGYHIVIRRTGVVENGRPLTEYGAHCHGHNEDSLGVCYVGRRKPTDQQLDAIAELFLRFRDEYGIKADKWFCHYEFDAGKECPGLPGNLLRRWLSTLG